MAIDKIFDGAVDGIADNLFNSVSNSVSEIKAMQQRKAAENVQLVVQALKKIDADIREKYDGVTETFDKRIASIKDGRDGKDGKNGLDGVNGKDGRDGKDGRNGRDGLTGPRGFDGPKGLDGKDGRDGEDGVSVTDAHIDFDGSLIISLSSGRVINVGEVVAADIAEKIKVITNGGGTSQPVLDKLASLQEQIDLIASALVYKGTWNASTNTPTLTSSVGTANSFYIVSVAGTTNLNGTSNWGVGDWAVFNGSVWQRVEGGAVGNFTDLTVSGTTTLSNLTASTALALNASKEVVSVTNTGTGNNVLATSPTLVTPALGTPSSATLTNATGLPLSSGVTGTLPIANGGTGQTTANAAFNALAPSQASNSGKYLTTNGTDTSWATLSGLGTVTSVGATVPSFLSITGSPITSSGTLAISLSGTALPTTSGGTGLTSFTANGVVYASSSSALTTGSALTFDGSKLVNTGYNKSTYQVSTGAVGTFESVGAAYLTYDGETGASVYSRSNASSENTLTFRASTFSFKVGGTQVASLNSSTFSLQNIPILLSGSTSGYTGFAAPATSNFTIYTLPSADGTSGQSLTTNGSGTLSWASGTGGTVTSVSGTGTVSGISLSGTVTSSGNLTLGGALDLSAYSGAGAFTTLSASSTVTLSGGTANGVAYLNGSKVVTSGSALTFDGTNLALTTTGAIYKVPTAGGSLFDAGGNNGIYILGSSNYIATYVAGSEQMRLTSTGLGIGTSSPAAKLDVVGASAGSAVSTFTSNETGTTTSLAVFQRSGGAVAAAIKYNATNSPLTIDFGTTTSHALTFLTANTERMRLDSSGNLGIGTSSPVANTPLTLQALSGYTDILWLKSVGTNIDSRINIAPTGTGVAQLNNTNGTPIAFQISGSEVGRFTSTGLGIGTSSPAAKLHVAGENAIIDRSGGDPYLAFYTSGSTTNVNIYGGSSTGFRVFTGGSERLRVDSSGNLGLGVTPSAWGSGYKGLQVNSGLTLMGSSINGNVTANAYFDGTYWRFISNGYATTYYANYANNGSHVWGVTSSGTAGLGINGTSGVWTTAMTLDASGNLGVGVTDPATYGGVFVARSTSGANFSVRTLAGIGGSGTGVGLDALGNSAGSVVDIGIRGNTIQFRNSGSEAARIDSSGNLLLGTTSSTGAGASVGKFVTNFDGAVTNGIYVSDTRTSAGTDNAINFGRGATLVGRLDTTLTSLTLTNLSDQRVKTNVQDSENALGLVGSVKVRQFDWTIDNSHENFGFVAQELNEVLPQAVSVGKTEEEMWGVNFVKLVPILTKAIQEQQAIIDSLKARLDAANL